MVVLMGGRYSQGYELFQRLTVQSFLALRPHADQLVSTVQLMLGTGLPSFKGDVTIKRLKDRFYLEHNDRQAAEYMMNIIRNAHENIRSTAYDEFQRVSASQWILTLLTRLDSYRMVCLSFMTISRRDLFFSLCRHSVQLRAFSW